MINNPQEDIKLTSTQQAKVNKAKDLVTLSEAEVVRLRGIQHSLTYTVVELNKEIKEKEGKLETLDRTVTDKESLIGDKQESIDAMEDNLTDLVKTKEAVISDTNSYLKEARDLEEDLNINNRELDSRDKEVSKRESNINTREQKLVVFEEKIREFKKTI